MNIPQRLLAFSLLLSLGTSLYAQKVKKVTGTYTFYAPVSMSLMQAEQEALRRAQIEAVAAEFGTVISQSTTSVVTDRSEDFYQEGFGLVKGEWIETIGEPKFERGVYENGIYVKCTVTGRAREITSVRTELDIKVLCNQPDERFESRDFKKGDKLFLHFLSPEDGFVAVYLYDNVNDVVACLLPYKHDSRAVTAVAHDRPYVFFSKQTDRTGARVDEYVMGCEDDHEVNTLYIVFSRKAFSKPVLEDDDRRASPRSLTYEAFNRWLSKTQAQDKEMQVIRKSITISKQ